MEIVITEWALQSYLDMKHSGVFNAAEYWQQIRPDVELLRDGVPSPHPRFKLSSFWGPATDKSHTAIAKDKREAAKLKDRIRKIYLGQYIYRGSL